MNLLIHDLACAIERDATDDYTVANRDPGSDETRREPIFRFRCGSIDEQLAYFPRDRRVIDAD